MDRARRAEPYSNATIWTREIARNLAGHLARISKAHSCVDTKSPKTRLLPKFQHGVNNKRCATSPVKARHPHHASELHNAVKEGDGSGPEQRVEEELDGEGHLVEDIDLHATQTAHNGDDREGIELRPVRQHRKLPKKKPRNPTKKSRMEADRLEMIAHENQRLQERLTKIATPNGKHQQHQLSRASSAHHHQSHPSSSDDSIMWDSSVDKPLSKIPHDYNKKQEQLKIWNENQALAKRLRTAKPTLNCKEWEKDDKWNQHFLKSQEKRRVALQHELAKAQMSPLAAVRVAKIGPHEASPGARSPSSATIVLMDSGRHHHPEEDSSKSSSDRATAANHRRIMMLRKQRSAPSEDQKKHAHQGATNQLENQFDVGLSSAEETCESDVVNVRFTFSRERRRSPGAESADSVTIEAASCFGERHNLFELGAFSPAIELESALDAMVVDPIEPETPVPENDCAAGGSESGDKEEACDIPESALGQSCVFTDEEINAVVFDTLQDSIDFIADALSSQEEREQHSRKPIAEERQKSSDQPVTIDEMMPTSPVPPFGAETATELREGTLSDAVDAVSSPDRSSDGMHSSEISVDTSNMTETHEGEPDAERIPHGEEAAQGLSHVAVDGSEFDESTKTEDASLDYPSESQEALLADPREVPRWESDGTSVEQEPEYGEENFDDDPHEPETSEPGTDASQLDSPSPEETQQTAVDANDEASGYGSEFDEDQEHQQPQPEESAGKEPEESGPGGGAENEDEDNADHYEDDEAPDSPNIVAIDGHELQKADEDELSYSDDGFSEGDDDDDDDT
ncbi:hypothetical protein Gpo141_00005603 [Globisporangium polare]